MRPILCSQKMHRVLVVEDDIAIRGDLVEILGEEGYAVAAAANGREALEALARDPLPCAVLLDLQMPVVDGWNVLRRVRGDERLRTLQVIVTSASDGPDGEVCLRKPARLGALLDAVERACSRGAA